jgi:signal peptidase I
MKTTRKSQRKSSFFSRQKGARKRKRTKKRPVLTAFIWLAVFIPLFAIFAPVQIGGQVGYIIVSGNSMLPNYQYYDLVLTWEDDNYHLGDVIAYNDPILGGIVFHRIVAIDGYQYQTKGDNNSWLDLYRPNPDEVIGKAWVQLHGVGEYILLLNRPGPFAAIVSAFALLLFVPSISNDKQRKKRR